MPQPARTSALDLSNLGFFQFNGGSGGSIVLGSGSRGQGTLILSNTGNLITATNITLGVSSGNNASNGTIVLGTGTNTINADTITLGGVKGGGGIQFASSTAGTLKLRGSGGTDTDRANITIGLRNSQGTPVASGINLGTHVVDMKVGTLQFENLNNSNSGSIQANVATMTMGAGTMDVNNIAMTTKTSGTTTVNAANTATFSLSGGNLLVNSSFVMTNVNTTATGTANLNSDFNITGGTATINSDITESGSTAANNNITLDGGTLNMMGHNIGLAAGQITLNANSGTLTNVAEINGGGVGLTKQTAGTLVLAGPNNYTGNTTVNAGVLIDAGRCPTPAT